MEAKEDYRQHARQMLNGFRYNEWLESGELSDEDSDHDVDLQASSKRSRDTTNEDGEKRRRRQ